MIWIFLVLVLVVIVLTIILSYYSWCKSILFMPTRDKLWVPKENYENIFLQKTKCNAWFFVRNPSYPVVLYLHGNGGNITYRKYVADLTRKIKCNLFLLDYRGYGESRPKHNISPMSILQDSEDAYMYLTEKYDPSNIIIWGESLGGAPSSYLASKYPCRSLIMFSTFSALDDIVRYYFEGFTGSVLGNLVKYTFTPFKNKEWMQKVQCPVLIVHSTEDELINFENGLTLFDSVQHQNKILLKIKGGHTDPKLNTEAVKLINRFCYTNDQSFMSEEEAQNILDSLEDGCSIIRTEWKNRKKPYNLII